MREVELFPGYLPSLGLGNIHHDDLGDHTWLEILQGMVGRTYPAPSIGARPDFALSRVSEGPAVSCGLPSERHRTAR